MKKVLLIAALLAATGTTQAAKACNQGICKLPRTEAMAEQFAANRCKKVFHLAPPSKAFDECVKQKKTEFLERQQGDKKGTTRVPFRLTN